MAKKPIEDVTIPHELDKPFEFKLDSIKFKNETQFEIVKLLTDDTSNIVFIEGPAGTAKSHLSIYAALKLLKTKKVDEILYMRAAVESADYGLGFMPGTVEDKIALYMQPLEEKLDKFLTNKTIKDLKSHGKIKASPINFIRGCDWQNKCVILDEAQSLSYREFKTFMTRIGEGCKIFIIGDKMQSDIGNKSALPRILEMFDGEEHVAQGIHIKYLTEKDIVRSGICRHITKQFTLVDKIMRTREG